MGSLEVDRFETYDRKGLDRQGEPATMDDNNGDSSSEEEMTKEDTGSEGEEGAKSRSGSESDSGGSSSGSEKAAGKKSRSHKKKVHSMAVNERSPPILSSGQQGSVVKETVKTEVVRTKQICEENTFETKICITWEADSKDFGMKRVHIIGKDHLKTLFPIKNTDIDALLAGNNRYSDVIEPPLEHTHIISVTPLKVSNPTMFTFAVVASCGSEQQNHVGNWNGLNLSPKKKDTDCCMMTITPGTHHFSHCDPIVDNQREMKSKFFNEFGFASAERMKMSDTAQIEGRFHVYTGTPLHKLIIGNAESLKYLKGDISRYQDREIERISSEIIKEALIKYKNMVSTHMKGLLDLSRNNLKFELVPLNSNVYDSGVKHMVEVELMIKYTFPIDTEERFLTRQSKKGPIAEVIEL